MSTTKGERPKLKDLTPLGQYLSTYSAAMMGQMCLVVSESTASALTATHTAWDKFTGGIMALLSLPAKVAKSASKGKKAKRALTIEEHKQLLGISPAQWEAILWAKECRETWNKSADALRSMLGVNVGPMPETFPGEHRERIQAEAKAKAVEIIAQVTADPKPEHTPPATALAAIAPGMALAVIAEPEAEAMHQGTAPVDTGAGDASADSGELPPPLPDGPGTEPDAAPSSGPITPDVPAGGSDTAPVAALGNTEPCADAACASCEPEPVTEATPEARELPQDVSPEVVAALAGALALVPTGPTEPVPGPLGDGPAPEAGDTPAATGPEATEDGAGELQTDGTAPDAEAVAQADATENGSEAQADAPVEAPGQTDTTPEAPAPETTPDPLPETAPSVPASTDGAGAGDAGPVQTGPAPEVAGTATEAPASPTEPEAQPQAEPDSLALVPGAVAPGMGFVAPLDVAPDLGPLVPSPEAVAMAAQEPVALVGDGSDDPLAEKRAEIDATLDIAWSEHCASPSEASARHVRSLARKALNESPEVFSHSDLHRWRERTRPYIPQTNNLGRTGRGSAAYAVAAVQEMTVTPAQEEASAILAAARATSLASGEGTEQHAADAGIMLGDEGRPHN